MKINADLCLVVCLLIKCSVVESACTAPDRNPDDEFPDIFNSDFHAFIMEMTNKFEKTSTYVIEHYDRKSGRGRLGFWKGGIKTTALYYKDTSELFIVQNDTCRTLDLLTLMDDSPSSTAKLPWPGDWIDQDKNQPFIGPSKMLRTFHQKWQDGQKVGRLSEKRNIRGTSANVWMTCLDDETTLEVFLTDPITDPDLGLINIPVPLRMAVSSEERMQYLDFIGVDMLFKDRNELFEIPTQVGCKRRKPDLKKMPAFDSQDLYYEAEVVYRPAVDSSKYSYVTTLSVAIHHASQHVAIQMTPWNSGDLNNPKQGDTVLNVYDLKNKYVYVVDKANDECQIKSFDAPHPTLDLPDGTKLNLLDPDIFISEKPSTDFHYMGQGKARGIAASIYEKVLTDDDGIGQAISTRYYLADGVNMRVDSVEKNVPMRVVFLDLFSTSAKENFTGQVEVNYFDFQNHLINTRQKFDVSLCFPEDTNSKWFQLLFPLNGIDPHDIMEKIALIEERFFDLLNAPFLAESPVRFPVLKADVNADNLFVTGRILDRPPLTGPDSKYKETTKQRTLDPNTASRLGMLTLEECARACFERSANCQKFSYCGAMCDIDNMNSPNVIEKTGCSIYEDKNPDDGLLTMDSLSEKIAGTLDPPGTLTLTIPGNRNQPLQLTASKFKDGVGFGVGNIRNTFEDVLDETFEVYRYGSKLDPSEANESGVNLLERSLASCHRDCAQSPNCVALSYCKLDRKCFLSTKLPSTMPPDHITQDTQCIIYYRPFLQFFERFPGIFMSRSAYRSLNVNMEECAQECLKDKSSCRSFDFCPDSTATPCRMHRVHLVEQKETDIGQSNVCGHYSRKYTMDFMRKMHEELTDGVTLQIGNVTSEWCARTCADRLSCKGFNYCVDYASKSSTCQFQSKPGIKTKENLKCSAFIRK